MKNKMKRAHLEKIQKQKSMEGIPINTKPLAQLKEEWEIGKEEVQTRKETLRRDFSREWRRLDLLDKAAGELSNMKFGTTPEQKLDGALRHLRDL